LIRTYAKPSSSNKIEKKIEKTNKEIVETKLEILETQIISTNEVVKSEMKQWKVVTFLMAMTIPGSGKTKLKAEISKFL
jgi:arginine deiminase